jgi:hypothetical protein
VTADGVHFSIGTGSLLNAKGAEIFGTQIGVFLGGDYLATNRGTIVGAEDAGVELGKNTSGGAINNYGYIFGQIDGVSDLSLDGPATIHNYKTIRSDDTGINIHTDPAITTTITNAIGAVIDGGIHGVFCDRGAFKLVNRGTIIGSVDDADGANVVIINSGNIDGIVNLEGNSIYNGRGGRCGPIHVGGGNDKLILGPGADRIFFDAALTGQVDKFTNFDPIHDRLALSETDFPGIGPIGGALATGEFKVGTHAITPSQHIIYNPRNGFVFYDPDGNGGLPQVHFATMDHGVHLTHNDFLVVA